MEQSKKETQRIQEGNTGNASNPTPHSREMEPANNDQLLNEKAEKYLRESANIEDEPDAQGQQDADEIFRKEDQS
jgi:hypothetical protein